MRPGHKWSGGFEKRFQAHAEIQAVLVTIPQRELINQDGAECKPPRIGQSFGRHLAVTIEDSLELLVQVFNCARAQFVEHPSYVDTSISMRIAPATGRDQFASLCRTDRTNGGVIVMLVAQHITD